MITKTAEEILSKEAGFWKSLGKTLWNTRSWKTMPKAKDELINTGRELSTKLIPAIRSVGGAMGSGAAKAGRAAEWTAGKIMKNPLVGIPVVAGTALAASEFEDRNTAYDTHIATVNTGITRVQPFTGKIKFTNPAYAEYYRNQ